MSNSTLTETTRPGTGNDQIIPYYVLRILIGAAGISLPLLLIIGKLIVENSFTIEYSISDYYDNGTAGDILVGILFALAFFLVSYKGYARIDNIIASLGCFFALGVALCPTTSSCRPVHVLHFVFAVLLFTVFILFSLWLFRKSGGHTSKQKDKRNKVYMFCGIIMIFCIILIAILSLTHFADEWSQKYHPVFWLESLALVSFGFSWITKAEVVFKEDGGHKNK